MSKARAIIGLSLSALLVSGCAVFGTKETDQKLEQEISALMLDQQILETRLSLTEDRVTALQTHLNEMQETLFAQDKKTEPVAAVTPKKPKTVAQTAPKASAASSAGAAADYKDAFAAYNAGKYKQSESMFRDFAKKYPKSPLAANAGYWLGESCYSQGRYDDAILAFQSVARQYPKHDKAAASLLKTGYSYERLADKPNARFYLEQLLENYPKSEPAPLARAALARI